jgi:choline kinase
MKIRTSLILAAGLGERLRPHTSTVPKALVEIAGKPILAYQLQALVENGISEFVIVHGYHGEKIVSYVKKMFPQIHAIFVHNEIYDKTNSAYSFSLAEKYISEPYIHLNCDILFLPSLIKKIIESDEDNLIVMDNRVQLKTNQEKVTIDRNNKIIMMDNMDLPGAVGKAIGIAKIDRELLLYVKQKAREYAKAGEVNKNFYGILREAVHELPIYCKPFPNELLTEVNTIEDMKIAEKLVTQSLRNTTKL